MPVWNTVLRTKDVSAYVPLKYAKNGVRNSLNTKSSVVDPWHFGTDPDQGIRTTDFRIRIRLLLFSSVADKMPTKKKFSNFFCLPYYFLKVHLHQSSNIKKVKKRSHKIVEIKGFLTSSGSRSRSIIICTDPDPGGPSRIRIRIHNTSKRQSFHKQRSFSHG